MKKVRVYGTATISVSTVIEVEDDMELDDIIDKASCEFGGISSYCGNGGMDKLIGVTGDNSIDASYAEIVFAPNGEEDIEEE